MLDDFRTHNQIVFDLTANYLEPLDGSFERLAYLYSLRDSSSGKYVHERLAAAYGAEPVDQVLARCHEEVFERLLEMPLTNQEEDLCRHINSYSGSMAEKVSRCRAVATSWIPSQSPSYLKELFCSNLNALLELLLDDPTKARSDT
jgi:hypothetical protein